MNIVNKCLTGAAIAAAACLLPGTARAEHVVVEQPATTTTPNRALLHSGIVTLGISYVPAFIVAVESSRTFDNDLYIPVAGPWMDFARRDCPDCRHETFNKVMLVTDGIFQGIGALDIVGAFLFPETHTATASRPMRLHLADVSVGPARFAAGSYGVMAAGHF